MKRSIATTLLTIICLTVVSLSLAAKPPSSGGGGDVSQPAGTIFYSWALATLQGWESRGDWMMKADGSNKQLISNDYLFWNDDGARLSHQMHGEASWLLEYDVNPATGNFSLYATSAFGDASVLLADGASISGTDDLWGAAVWGKDDSFVSVVTFDWENPGAYCQLYRAEIGFDENGMPGVTSDWEWVTSGNVPGEVDIDNSDWSRDGTRVALGMIPNDGITPAYVVVYDTAAELDWVLTTSGYNPRWSPLLIALPTNRSIKACSPSIPTAVAWCN